MLQYALKKEDFDRFIARVMKEYGFVAPVMPNSTKQFSKSSFQKINSPKEIHLEKKSYYPVKTYFFKTDETIFEFKDGKIADPKLELKPTVYFGLRRCDLNGIWHQDIVFLEEHEDPFYKARRDASILIGFHCKEGDDYCFCNSFDLKDFFDIMFYDKGGNYILEIGSEKGNAFIKKFKNLLKETSSANGLTADDKKTINKKSLVTLDIKNDYNREEWKKGSDICISCGACNFLCMNCHCFDLSDEVSLDLKTGKRLRKPASCQLRSFTRVAGNNVFRNERNARFKHRIYHQMQYFKDRYNVDFCTGCGRCIGGCPVRIDWVEIINNMKE
jgi:ferredoxin